MSLDGCRIEHVGLEPSGVCLGFFGISEQVLHPRHTLSHAAHLFFCEQVRFDEDDCCHHSVQVNS